ncbi:hypothetical protein M378DRAFT_14099 [Amanita muscaria Koide BX008]|uniref:Uncharacterized protein n=1 Tax=Amanita muscaria (strain Koide BX008) TaxID=946122 RepID=A0A0C2SCB4_AMAMK|nr:hypothetical protein M378DRAFT_14099 [Amanita muscaria Koide BX008]
MAPRSWATEDQLKFLRGQLDDFFAAQKAGKLVAFWPKVQKIWYQEWPEPGMEEGQPARSDLVASIQVRNKQLQNWFYNHRENNRNRGMQLAPIILNVKQKRTLSAVQLYSAEKYTGAIKSDVMSEIQENSIPKNKTLQVVLRQTAEKFRAEPPEVQMHYKEKSEKLKQQRLEEKKAATKSVGDPTPASEIKNLTPAIDALLLDLHKRTGWSFLVLAGGPDPVSGKIRTLSFNEGQNMAGHTFAKCHPAFENDYIKPFLSFLKQTYSPAIREARRLIAGDGNSTPALSDEPTITFPGATGSEVYTSLESGMEIGSANEPQPALHNVNQVQVSRETEHEGTHTSTRGNKESATGGDDESTRGGDDESRRGDDRDDETATGEANHDWLDPSLRSSTIVIGAAFPNQNTPISGPCEDENSPPPFPERPLMPDVPCANDNLGQSEGADNVQTDTNTTSRSQRTRRAAAPKVPVTLGDKHSEWLQGSYSCLLYDNCDTIWSETVEAWLQFEKDLPLVNISSGRLPAIKYRPTELSKWLMTRNFTSPPPISDVSAYAESMKTWWTNMKTPTNKTQSSGALHHLRNGGPNGIVTLLFGLRWWQLNLNQDAAQWDVVLKEIHGMLKEFAGTAPKSATKRKSDLPSNKNAKRRKSVGN